MTEHIHIGRFDHDLRSRRLRPGMPVVDSFGATIGRIRHLHHPDPLAIADDGRRIGQAGDIAAMLPGWCVHTLPRLPGATAARLIREGYLKIVGGLPPARVRYAALTDVASYDDQSVQLAVGTDDLPAEGQNSR